MKTLFKTTAFDYRGFSLINEKVFYSSIVGFVLYGLFTSYLTSLFAPTEISLIELILIGLVLPIVGCLISLSDNMTTSFLGYNLIVIPIGYILGPTLNNYSPNLLQDALLITGFMTLLFGFAGVIYPNLFKSLGGILFYSLMGLVIVRLLSIFIPGLNLGIIDYISAGIFSLYIGYDMYRASNASRTYTGALHIAVSLYLDIINLFMSILSILKN